MPVSFLSEEQRSRHGRYAGEPSDEQLARYFHLDDADHEWIALRRGDHNRLGCALQLCTARFLGAFLEDVREAPAGVVAHLARQLGIFLLPGEALAYGASNHRWEHTAEIRQRGGYRELAFDAAARFELSRWLYALCWTGTDRPSVLFDRATAWMLARKVLLPGVSALERLVARIRQRVQERLWHRLGRGLNPETRRRLEALLEVPEGASDSALESLRAGPTRRSAPELVRALERLAAIRALGIDVGAAGRVPPGRVRVLARFAELAKVTAIARLTPARRTATLAAFLHTLEAAAQDDALDLLDVLLGEMFAAATKAGEQARLRTLKDLDAAALQLGRACGVLLDEAITGDAVRGAVFARIERGELAAAVGRVEALARPPEDVYCRELLAGYGRVRRFLPTLLRTVRFEATPAGEPVRAALDYLARVEEQGRAQAGAPPLDFVGRSWRRHVVGADGAVEPKAYVFCALERARAALRRRDLFAAPSVRYADARLGLLGGAAWEAARATVCRSLGHPADAATALAAWSARLDAAYRQVAARLPVNTAVRVEPRAGDGKDELVLTALDRLEEPASLVALRAAVQARLPRVDLPEVLLEIAARTGFAERFTHFSEREARAADLATSLCAVLVAEACNTGIEPLARADVPALRRSRLQWVSQNYVRQETIAQANACLVAAQNRINLVQLWGGGEVASADGLRFVVPVRTVHAGPNPRYFGPGRGVTYYNLVSDQFTGLHALAVPGTLRDSLSLLGLVLEQPTELAPVEIMTDTGAYTDVVFGLFALLGYRFSPRLADIGGARFWRVDPAADYGALDGIARHRINTGLIARHWDDLLRLGGSLQLGLVQAHGVMRTLQVAERPTRLALAVAEVGRIDKTLHALSYLDDEGQRRRILRQLNRGEERHRLARAVFHGQRGELRQRYHQGQEDQLGVLGLVVNVLVLWNTLYLDAALAALRTEGFPVREEEVARLSPLGCEHINLLGRYAFSVPDQVRRGELRPLRDPAAAAAENR